MMEIIRKSKNMYEKKHRQLRKRQKKAVNVVLNLSQFLLDWPDDEPMLMDMLWRQVNKRAVQTSVEDFRTLKQLNDRGYADILLARYPSLRKYFADFIKLPFEAAPGSGSLLEAIELIRQLDSGQLKRLPAKVPMAFVPRELRPA